MPKRRSSRKPGRKRKDINITHPKRSVERELSHIRKLMDEHDFASHEEAEAFLREALIDKKMQPPPSPTPLGQAQDLIYDAWEYPTKRRRVELAQQALRISNDCADAYSLLAEETAKSPEEAGKLYEKAVKAGERALGDKVFKEDVGRFWGILETRPYMRARAGLAQCLWVLGSRELAIEHYIDMLRLNPRDNQGIRYLLTSCLLEEGLDKDFDRLVKRYEKDYAAAWLYPIALRTFRGQGPGRKANRSLAEALSENRYVPKYLLGVKKLPKLLPEYYSHGDEDEAVLYVTDGLASWLATKGALEWLAFSLHSTNLNPAAGD